jgi:cytochrome c oxidase subunit 2
MGAGMQRHYTILFVIWLVVAIITGLGMAAWQPFPTHGAIEADVTDDAFRALLYLATPVFALVIAVLAYALWKFRSSGPDEDGAPIEGKGALPKIWLAITAALCGLMIIWPGLTGLAELREHAEHPDMVVKVSGARWSWTVEYPDSGVKITGKEPMVLPADKRIRFEVTAVDVLHAFWVPAFRLKVDAVPGMTTSVTVTPNRAGDPQTDAAYRLQCSELCGLQHANMAMPVRVVSEQEFQTWLRDKRAKAEAR